MDPNAKIHACDAGYMQIEGKPCSECGAKPHEMCKRYWQQDDAETPLFQQLED